MNLYIVLGPDARPVKFTTVPEQALPFAENSQYLVLTIPNVTVLTGVVEDASGSVAEA